jgi:hypothetical protein
MLLICMELSLRWLGLFAFCFTSNNLVDPGTPLINMQFADHDKHDSDSMEDVKRTTEQRDEAHFSLF